MDVDWFAMSLQNLNVLSFKEMVTRYTQMFQRPSTSCVCGCLFEVVGCSHREPDPQTATRPPQPPTFGSNDSALRNDADMQSRWHLTPMHAQTRTLCQQKHTQSSTRMDQPMGLYALRGEKAFLCFEKHHYITLLHKARALRWPLQSAQRGAICHVVTLVAASAGERGLTC